VRKVQANGEKPDYENNTTEPDKKCLSEEVKIKKCGYRLSKRRKN